MDADEVAYPYNGCYSAVKRMSSDRATPWMHLESTVLSEESQAPKDKCPQEANPQRREAD